MINFQNIGSPIKEFHPADANEIASIEDEIRVKKHEISSTRPDGVVSRIEARGRLTAEARVCLLCDDEPWFFQELAGYDQPQEGRNRPYRLGVITALGCIKGRQAIIVANDNTITAGSWWPGSPEKIIHALDIAKRLQIPVFYLIECAGLYLAHQEQTYASEHGAGGIFEKQAQLNRCGILQVAGIFGDCIAGGGYMPLLCDKIVMTEQAGMCIGGSAITSHSRGCCDGRLGSPSVHVHLSGCAECRVPDDRAAIERLRTWAETMPSSANDFYRLEETVQPPFDIDELYHLLPVDLSKPADIQQIMSRIVDAGQIEFLHDDAGKEILAAFALIEGLPVVLIANRTETTRDEENRVHGGGILYREGITKMRQICEAADSDGVPVIWFQDVSGFDIGSEAEASGLLRHGAMLLRELAEDEMRTPAHMTVLLRKASGAGYYAMKGAPFHPAFVVATALTRLEVMASETLAGTLYDRKIASASEDVRQSLEKAKAETLQKQAQNAMPLAAAMRGDVDDVVALSDLRNLLGRFLKAAWQNGNRSVKPVRLWSLLNG